MRHLALKASLLLATAAAAACGNINDAGLVLQGSGATGKQARDDVRSEPGDARPPQDDAPARDRLRYTVRYDERASTLSYHAWIASQDPIPGTEMPGTMTGDGLPFVHDSRLGHSYGLTRTDVAPADQITTRVRYEGDGPVIEDTITIPRIGIGAVQGQVSNSRGLSVTWTGPALREGEWIEVRLRQHGSQYVHDVSAWGQVGLPNTVLWIDGDVLRIPPRNGLGLVEGAEYELWISRATPVASGARIYQTEYESAALIVTAAP